MNTTDEPAGPWLTLAQASRILGTDPSSTKSMAIAGAIRALARPGARILYSGTDCRRWAQRCAEMIRALEAEGF
jgi:hypothetical protein